jgi:hypothetical protein
MTPLEAVLTALTIAAIIGFRAWAETLPTDQQNKNEDSNANV